MKTGRKGHAGRDSASGIRRPRTGARRAPRRGDQGDEPFVLAQEALGFVTWIWDLQRDRVQWRGDMARLLGLAPGRFPGRFRDYLNCLHPDDRAEARSTYIACLKGAQPEYRSVKRIVWPDGSVRWLEVYGRGSYGADGRATRMSGVIKDVTDRKKEESARASAEQLVAALFESSPEAITLLRLSDGVRLAANAAWERFTGYSRSDAMGRSAMSMTLFRDPARRAALIALAEAEGGFANEDARLVRADGVEQEASISAVLIELDGERCILWTWRDVTDERGAKHARQAADARYRALFESTMDGIVILSPDWTFVDVNPSALRLSGYAREEIVGRSVELVFDKDELARNPIVSDRQWVLVERELTVRGGRKRPIEVMSGPLPDGNIIAVARDITERKRAEALVRRLNQSLEEKVRQRTLALEDANAQLDSFNYSVSHDLRQPLNAIGGFAELLGQHLGGSTAVEALRCAREIEHNAERMEQMIRALLEFSRAGRNELTLAAVDMRRQVESVVRDFAAGGVLRAQVSIGELPPARGDAALLRQVWTNLIGNAVKYSAKSGAPRVEVSGARRDGSTQYAVRDNGVGFDMRHADRLFGVFQRLPGSAGFEGAGVGLAIVERIVRRHGGAVSAESAPGQGATIRFVLPA